MLYQMLMELPQIKSDLCKEIERKKGRISSQNGRENARCDEEEGGHDGAKRRDAFRVVELALQITLVNCFGTYLNG